MMAAVDVLSVLEDIGCDTENDVSNVAEKIARLFVEDIYEEEYTCENGVRIFIRRGKDNIEVEVVGGPDWAS